jgi:hypothetical protein
MASFRSFPSRKASNSRHAKVREIKPTKKVTIITQVNDVKITPKINRIDRVELVRKARQSNIVKSKMIRFDRRNHINLTNQYINPDEDAFCDNHPWYEDDYMTMYSDDFPEVNYMSFEEIPV